jgi:hypothetical protein
VIGILRKELELSERNSMGHKAEKKTKELEMGRNYDRNRDGTPGRGSGRMIFKGHLKS